MGQQRRETGCPHITQPLIYVPWRIMMAMDDLYDRCTNLDQSEQANSELYAILVQSKMRKRTFQYCGVP